MGYEVLDAGGDAARPHHPDRGPGDGVEVLDLDGAPTATGADPSPRLPRRGLLAAAAAALLGVGALAAQQGGADQTAAPGPTPSPAPTSASTLVPGPTPDVDTGLPLSTSLDLRTSISVGHARVPGRPVSRQIAALQGALATRVVNASYFFVPDRYTDGASGPAGVRVVFNRRLSDDAWFSARDALNEVDPTTSSLETVTGTTVDISVPVTPDARCVAVAGSADAAGVLDLTEPETEQISALLPMFGLRASDGRAVVTYVGPFRTRAALTSVGAVLARACDGPAGEVTFTRGPVYSS